MHTDKYELTNIERVLLSLSEGKISDIVSIFYHQKEQNWLLTPVSPKIQLLEIKSETSIEPEYSSPPSICFIITSKGEYYHKWVEVTRQSEDSNVFDFNFPALE